MLGAKEWKKLKLANLQWHCKYDLKLAFYVQFCYTLLIYYAALKLHVEKSVIVNHFLRNVLSGYLSPMQRLPKRRETELGVRRCTGDVGKEGKHRNLYSLFSFPAFHTCSIIFTPQPVNYQPMVMAAQKTLLQRREVTINIYKLKCSFATVKCRCALYVSKSHC